MHEADLYRQGVQGGRLPSSALVLDGVQAGAEISDDLSACDVIVGVKEIPADQVLPGKMHFCFSHSHKGQPKGAALLGAFRDKKATLVDYELLTDGQGARVLAFGKFAGYAGMINCLHGLGDRFLQLGYRTPFLVPACLAACLMLAAEFRAGPPLPVAGGGEEGGGLGGQGD